MVDNQSSLAPDDNSMGIEDFDVIVIGAGLTGLTAARNLAAEKYKVLIFESSDRVGGRAWTKRFPGSSVNVDMGGEFYDVNCHHHTVAEVKRQNLPIERLGYQDSTAWFFAYPGKAYITPAICHPDFKEEYERAMHQINEDIGRINFREGLEQGSVMFLDVPFAEYVRERCKTTTKFVQEYLLSEAFSMFHANPEALSALSVLHCLAGFGTPEEILNTRPRLGEPFKKPEYARIGAGLGALAERIANEFIALGGEIRFNSAIGTIVCEPVPTRGSKRYCAICTRYSYPKCSMHGPRVRVADALGREYRGRGCILATPLNCVPCFKVDPALGHSLQHAAEMCNISGDTAKVWMLAKNLATDVDAVQSWPDLVHTHVKETYNKREEEEATRVKAEEKYQAEIPDFFQVLRHNEAKGVTQRVQIERKYRYDYTSLQHDNTHYAETNDDATLAEGQKRAAHMHLFGKKEEMAAMAAKEQETILLSCLSASERDAREVRQRKRAAAIAHTKQQRDQADFSLGLRNEVDMDDAKAESAHDSKNGVDDGHRSLVAGFGLKEDLGEDGSYAPALLPKHFPSATALAVLTHDWKSDRHLRGGQFALRAGSAQVHAEACTLAEQPWPHTKNFIIAGSDVSIWWSGWIEGAMASGVDSSRAMLHFLNPPVPVANHIERRHNDTELVLKIEAERNEQKRIDKIAAKARAVEEAKERRARMFKY